MKKKRRRIRSKGDEAKGEAEEVLDEEEKETQIENKLLAGKSRKSVFEVSKGPQKTFFMEKKGDFHFTFISFSFLSLFFLTFFLSLWLNEP